jgi:hypothetical protein
MNNLRRTGRQNSIAGAIARPSEGGRPLVQQIQGYTDMSLPSMVGPESSIRRFF